ncbi:MAG: peptidase S8 [Acidobacteria bacterium]|nr:MAG: peptidase S8 [Acidobacteriota bacterium]
MNPLDMVKLTGLMEITSGISETIIGLIDGPVATNHPDLADQNIREVPGKMRGTCTRASSAACMHGTFVAGILCARRDSPAPAICPNCTLLVRSIFAETGSANKQLPSATPGELGAAIIECISAGARLINMSVALALPSSANEHELEEALDHAAKRGVIVVAAAGNQGTVGGSAITRHPWVIPVAASDRQGRPLAQSNMGNSIGRQGLSAPGDDIVSLGTNGQTFKAAGTSIAAPFVTGTIALLWSEFPAATAAQMKLAVTQVSGQRRVTVVPPLLDAWASYQFLLKAGLRRWAS